MGPKVKRRPKPLLSLDLTNCEQSVATDTDTSNNSALVAQPPTKLLDNLYVGSQTDVNVEFLVKHKISAILTIQTKNIDHAEQITQLVREIKFIPLPDRSSADISQFFEETAQFIDSHEKTLVHCAYGASRSVTICIAYLMKTKKKSFSDAFEYIRARRPMIQPNFSFLGQLVKYEKLINNNLTNTVDSGIMSDMLDSNGDMRD